MVSGESLSRSQKYSSWRTSPWTTSILGIFFATGGWGMGPPWYTGAGSGRDDGQDSRQRRVVRLVGLDDHVRCIAHDSDPIGAGRGVGRNEDAVGEPLRPAARKADADPRRSDAEIGGAARIGE